MCICILLSYQVCCFVTNVVKIIPSSECLFLCPFCICSAWERNGKRANSHRVYMYTFVLSESKRRVKPSADVRVVIPSKKKHNADYTGYTCSLKTCNICGIVLCDKTANFRVAFYCGQPKAHLCINHANLISILISYF